MNPGPWPICATDPEPPRVITDRDTLYAPVAIEILLHYYCCRDEFERMDAPATSETIQWAVDNGLLVPREPEGPDRASYEGTPRLRALVQAWCATPLPVQLWGIPR